MIKRQSKMWWAIVGLALCGLVVAGVLLSRKSKPPATTSRLSARLGDPAAPLVIKEWIKGQPVNVQDGRHVYVVEFWATWCGPCQMTIPFLTELQRRFKDQGVILIGISDEDPATVKPFVAKMGGKMDYVVACDDGRKSNRGYTEAYGQEGIPTAFVVGKNGQVLWCGHPMDNMDKVIEAVLVGQYDLQAAMKKDEFRALLNDYQLLSARGDAKAKDVGRQLLANTGGQVWPLCVLAFNLVANPAQTNRDFTLAEEALAQAEKTAGGEDHRILGVRSVVRFESGKQAEGLALAKRAIELSPAENDRRTYENFLRVMESRMAPPPKQP